MKSKNNVKSITLEDKYELGKFFTLALFDEQVNKIEDKTISIINEITSYSNANIELFKILEACIDAFSPLLFLPHIVCAKYTDERLSRFSPSVSLIDWGVFSDKYLEYTQRPLDHNLMKDFLKVSSLYYDLISDKFREDSIVNGEPIKRTIIQPIVAITPTRPTPISVFDIREEVQTFMRNDSMLTLKVIFPSSAGMISNWFTNISFSLIKLLYSLPNFQIFKSIEEAMHGIVKEINEQTVK